MQTKNGINWIIGKRGSGKTTELIKMSAETNTYILVLDTKRRENIVRMANRMGVRIPFPITLGEYGYERGFCKTFDKMPYTKILIDDVEDVLQAILGYDVPILAVTMTEAESEEK